MNDTYRETLRFCARLVIFLLFLMFLVMATAVVAAPILEASMGEVKIVVYDEPCKLPAISNLSRRATWTEPGKTFEGCAGVSPIGVVMFYFEDRTAAAVPVQAFVRVTGT